MATAQLMFFIDKHVGECMTPSPSEEKNWPARKDLSYTLLCVHFVAKCNAFDKDMNLEAKQCCGTSPPSWQNKMRFMCQMSTMRSTCQHGFFFKFSEKTVKITKLWYKIANKNVLDLKNFCSMMVTTNEVLEACPEWITAFFATRTAPYHQENRERKIHTNHSVRLFHLNSR